MMDQNSLDKYRDYRVPGKNSRRLLYYIGDAYPSLERLRKYQVRIIRYSPEKGTPYEDVWLIMDPYTVLDMLDKYGNRIHVDLNQFTEDLSKWRDDKIESIVNKND